MALRDSFDINAIWWHAGVLTSFEHNHNGGLHLGTLAQAQCRARPRDNLYAFTINISKARGAFGWTRDTELEWGRKCRNARYKKKKVLAYLNRYEGLDLDGYSDSCLDKMTDSEFKKSLPDAQWSLIVLDPSILVSLDTKTIKPLVLDYNKTQSRPYKPRLEMFDVRQYAA